MTEVNDFGFSTVDPVEIRPDDRAERLWKAIEPFLDNLSRNPEKDIHWPDRDIKIADFKKKLLGILDNSKLS